MPKKISFIPMDSELEQWLVTKLQSDPPGSKYTGELLTGLQEMMDGKVSSLMLDADGEHAAPANPDKITAGGMEIFRKSRRVTVDGKEINLTPKEFDILYFLAQNRGEVFTKEQIYRAVWDDDYLMDDSNIMAFIRKLRKKTEPNPDQPKYILTIWGIGYKFNDAL